MYGSNITGNNLLGICKKHDGNVHKQSMPRAASRNTTLFFSPVSLRHISRTPAIPVQWQSGCWLFLRAWTVLGPWLGLCALAGSLITCRIALWELLLCPSLQYQCELVSGKNFSSHLEKVRNHPEGKSRGGEASSSVMSLQHEWGLWKCIAIAKPVPRSILLGPNGKQGMQLQTQNPFIKICSVASYIKITSLHVCCIPFHCWL